MDYKKQPYSHGFTIVELLIVIVVIGILAAISIVAYNGIQSRARAAAVSSALEQTGRKLALYAVDNNSFPIDLATVGITSSGGTSYQYSVNNSVTPQTYCVTATNGTTSYKASSAATAPTSGGCAGHGQGGIVAVTNNAKNPYIKSGVTVGWSGYNPLGGQAFSTSPSSNGIRGAWRMTSGPAGIGSGSTTGYEYQGTGIIVTAGSTIYPSIYAQASQSGIYTVNCQFFNGTVLTGNCPPNNTNLSANTWVRLSDGAVTVPAATDRMNIRAQYVSGSSLVAGDWIDVTMVSTAQGGYADGDSLDWIWNGAPNNSTSTGPSI
ncbi:prepilin-type N-terminal cleavage/methylation domain-containing protein [Candidatus Saccharibacteria bacterium]|nr:prepilin-type N-terminal cleavage/methylation domain-containing protein [Candidatus Saccharibacteria bacterium]